jgi:multisubunit Na+/H+ antiporter MnhB subunit
MLKVFTTFVGYGLIAIGLFILYLVIFRKDRLPNIFSKAWFLILIIVGAIIALISGWMLVK